MRRGNSTTLGDKLLMAPLYDGTATHPSHKTPTLFV